MKVKTISSKEMWRSRDGTRTIWQVSLGTESGKIYALKTYSRQIATVGFRGDVESYVTPKGERFTRQKADALAKKALERRVAKNDSRDDLIRAEWAIGQAISLASATMDRENITMPVIERYARDLFTTVGRVQEA